jgi:hypothetical protein
LLGSPQIAGVQVQHVGQFKREAAMGPAALTAGALASEIGARIAAGKPSAIPAQTPEFKRPYVTLAVTDKEVALISHKVGAWTVKPGEVITRVARADVASAEVGKGTAPPLTITLANGDIWQFEISNPGILAVVPAWNNRRNGRRVAALLNGG